MKNIFSTLFIGLATVLATSSCLKHGYEELENSSEKALTAVNYSYRFLYNDTIQKGTAGQEILLNRVCDVVFSKVSTPITEGGAKGFSTTITHNENSVFKAGPSGSVTKAMLYDQFKKLIAKEQLSNLWVYVTISDVAKINPVKDAPVLGKPGDFSKDHTYRVTASNGSSQDYILKTVKGF